MLGDQREIKIPYAIRNGEWIHISQVESGLKSNCVCPCCKKVLLAKKGLKNVHHFAHYKKVDCQPETVLHFIAKTFIHQKIERHLNNRLPLNISWLCKFCKNKHETNLLRRATKARLEYTKFEVCRPDIVLLTENDAPVAVIEIVVTHKPEDSAVAYYQQNKIALIECDVFQGSDLELIQSADGLNATRIDQCTNLKCKQCGNPFSDLIVMFLVPQACRRCKQTMKVCFVRPTEWDIRGPKNFSENEILIAHQNGALLEMKFSATANESYLANTCPHCRAWIGEFFLHDYLPNEFDKKSEWEEFLIGHRCDKCKRDWPCKIERIRELSQQGLSQDNSQLRLFS